MMLAICAGARQRRREVGVAERESKRMTGARVLREGGREEEGESVGGRECGGDRWRERENTAGDGYRQEATGRVERRGGGERVKDQGKWCAREGGCLVIVSGTLALPLSCTPEI